MNLIIYKNNSKNINNPPQKSLSKQSKSSPKQTKQSPKCINLSPHKNNKKLTLSDSVNQTNNHQS